MLYLHKRIFKLSLYIIQLRCLMMEYKNIMFNWQNYGNYFLLVEHAFFWTFMSVLNVF